MMGRAVAQHTRCRICMWEADTQALAGAQRVPLEMAPQRVWLHGMPVRLQQGEPHCGLPVMCCLQQEKLDGGPCPSDGACNRRTLPTLELLGTSGRRCADLRCK